MVDRKTRNRRVEEGHWGNNANQAPTDKTPTTSLQSEREAEQEPEGFNEAVELESGNPNQVQEMQDRMGRLESMMEQILHASGGRSFQDVGEIHMEGVAQQRSHGAGQYKPIRPKHYARQRYSLILERGIRETEKFLERSHIEY